MDVYAWNQPWTGAQGFDGRAFQSRKPKEPHFCHKNLFFVHWFMIPIRELLKRRVGITNVAGLDSTYPLGEMEGVGNSFPGRVEISQLK